MKDQDLVYAIYQYGSFSRAADELFISQSSLSMAIQRIENELGIPLFDRKRHPICLTEAGQEYIRCYQKIKPIEDDMLARLRDMIDLKTGRLVLGGTNYLLSYVLRDCVCRFMQEHPGVDMQIAEAPSEAFSGLLHDCKIDLCLKCDINDPREQSISHAFYDHLLLAVPKRMAAERKLGGEPLSVADVQKNVFVPSEHFFRTEDLEKITFLQLTPGNNLYKRSEMIFEELGCRPRRILHFQQFVTTYNFASAGLGGTLTSTSLIRQLGKRELVFYTLPSKLMIRDFHFITRKDAYISYAAMAFCKMFLEMNEQRKPASVPQAD